MRLNTKFVLLALSTGLVSLSLGTCLFRWLGDYVGDTISFAQSVDLSSDAAVLRLRAARPRRVAF